MPHGTLEQKREYMREYMRTYRVKKPEKMKPEGLKKTNLWLEPESLKWIKRKFGNKRLSCSVQQAIDEMIERMRPQPIAFDAPRPKPQSDIPWPDKSKLMGGR